MSGRVLPTITNVGATPIFAPASGGGGGGGGSNLSVSTISVSPNGGIIMNTDANFDTPALTFNVIADGSLSENFLFRDAQAGNLSDGGKFLALQYFTPGLNTAGILGVRGLNFSSQFEGEAGAGVIGVATGGTSIYATNVSSINGSAYPPPAEVIPQNLTVSTLVANTTGFIDAPAVSGSLRLQKRDGVGGSLVYLSNGVNTSELDFTPTGLGVVGNLGVSGSNFTLSPGFSITGNATTNLTTMAISGGQMIINNVSSIASVYGSFNSTNTFAAAIGNANISSIYNVANNLPGQNAPSLIPIGIPGVSDNTYQTNMVQAGYVQDLPFLSTVLFPRPYPNDNSLPLVILTPTNRNVSAGGNPQMSLNAGYGNYNTGVSSIGFSVDARNGGVGYVGSFNWLAIPQTT